jgi:hypothetical protein
MDMAKRKESTVPEQLLDELLKGVSKPEDLLGPEGLFKSLKKALV